MHKKTFKPLFVIAAPLASACASASPLSPPVDVPGLVAPTMNGVVNAATPYLGYMENIRPIRGPGSLPTNPVPLPGLEQLGTDNPHPAGAPRSAGK